MIPLLICFISGLFLQLSRQRAPIYSSVYFISSHTFRKKKERDTLPNGDHLLFSYWGGKNLQLVSCSYFCYNKKKRERERKRENYYANTLQFGFKYSLYYDEQFPFNTNSVYLPGLFSCLNIGKGKEKKI